MRVVAISVDPPDVSKKHAAKQGYTFPILSDENRETLRKYDLVHEGGFGLSRTSMGGFLFTDPAGKPISAAPEKRFRGNVFELVANNRRQGINITPRTPIPGWLGESLDVGIVVEGLLRRE